MKTHETTVRRKRFRHNGEGLSIIGHTEPVMVGMKEIKTSHFKAGILYGSSLSNAADA
jgi:hypothetical protein